MSLAEELFARGYGLFVVMEESVLGSKASWGGGEWGMVGFWCED